MTIERLTRKLGAVFEHSPVAYPLFRSPEQLATTIYEKLSLNSQERMIPSSLTETKDEVWTDFLMSDVNSTDVIGDMVHASVDQLMDKVSDDPALQKMGEHFVHSFLECAKKTYSLDDFQRHFLKSPGWIGFLDFMWKTVPVDGFIDELDVHFRVLVRNDAHVSMHSQLTGKEKDVRHSIEESASSIINDLVTRAAHLLRARADQLSCDLKHVVRQDRN